MTYPIIVLRRATETVFPKQCMYVNLFHIYYGLPLSNFKVSYVYNDYTVQGHSHKISISKHYKVPKLEHYLS